MADAGVDADSQEKEVRGGLYGSERRAGVQEERWTEGGQGEQSRVGMYRETKVSKTR